MRGCNCAAYGRCPACQRRVCLQHFSEHHKIEIEPYFDVLIACAELTGEMSQFKLASLEKLKTDMLLSAPHIHRDYVHPNELFRLEELLTIINSHMDRYSKHELLEDSTTPNTPPTISIMINLFYH